MHRFRRGSSFLVRDRQQRWPRDYLGGSVTMHDSSRYAGVPGSRARARSCAAANSAVEIPRALASASAVRSVNWVSPRSIAPTIDVEIPARLPSSGCVSPRSTRQSPGNRAVGSTKTTSEMSRPRAVITRPSTSTLGVLTPCSQWYSVVTPTRAMRARSLRASDCDSLSSRSASPEKPLRTRRLTRTACSRGPRTCSDTLPHFPSIAI